MKFSTDVNRYGGTGVEGWVVVLEARVWSGLGMLESVIVSIGGFRICSFSFFFFHFRSCPLRGGGAIRPDTRYHGGVPCFCFMKWAGDAG